MSIPTVFMLIGLPCSGKTSYRKKHLNAYLCVSTDDYILARAAFEKISYSEAWKLYFKEADRRMYEEVAFNTENRYNFIWDQTNLSRKSRLKKLALIPKEYRKVAIVLPEPSFEEFQQRNAYRRNEISDGVFKRLALSCEVVMPNEGFDEVRLILNI